MARGRLGSVVHRALAGFLAVGLLSACGASRPEHSATTRLTSRRVAAIAVEEAKGLGDARPVSVQYVRGDRASLVHRSSGDIVSTSSPAQGSSLLIVVRGRFVMADAGLPGAAPVRGTVITLVVDSQGETTDFGLASRMPGRSTLANAISVPAATLKAAEH